MRAVNGARLTYDCGRETKRDGVIVKLLAAEEEERGGSRAGSRRGSMRRRVRVKERQAREAEKVERGKVQRGTGGKGKTRRCLKVT